MGLLAAFRSIFKKKRKARRVTRISGAPSRRFPAAAHYYALYYPLGREPGSGWKYPKKHFGPFATQAEARATIIGEIQTYGEPRSRYKIKKLTGAQALVAIGDGQGY